MTADPCRAWRGDLAALALGHLDPEARARTLAHVDACDECRAELAELQRVARALPLASVEHLDLLVDVPSGDLVDRITRSAREERAEGRRTRRRRAASIVLGVAAALALGVAGFFIASDRASNPDLQPFAVAPAGITARFGLERNDQGTQIVFQQNGLDPERIYWMWLTDENGQRYGAGTFRGTTNAETIRMQSALPLDKTVRVWCTDAETDVVLDSWVR